jgi:hypothetical protein
MPLYRPSEDPCACGQPKSQVAKVCTRCRRARITQPCAACGQPFTMVPSRPRAACSRECAYRLRGQRSRDTQSRRQTLVCEWCGAEKLAPPSRAARRFCSPVCAYAANTGAGNIRWKGGVTTESRAFYSSTEWRNLCARVWARDRRHCLRCSQIWTRGSESFHVHHVASWTRYPELRLDMDNLVLLCAPCHRSVHSAANTRGDFIRR